MKTILLTLGLILTGLLQGATLVQTLETSKITTTVTLDQGVYNYEYTISSKPIDGKHAISHISISLCNSANVFAAYADDLFTAEITANSFKFDSIVPAGDTFVFGFSSLKQPELSTAIAKAATATETYMVLAPTCRPNDVQLPEPSSVIMVGLAGMTLLIRRRK
jgi:hypothetical protein